MAIKKNDNRVLVNFPYWAHSPKEIKRIENLVQHDRELAECYMIIDERFGPEWLDIPADEKKQLKIEIRKEAKKRCQ